MMLYLLRKAQGRVETTIIVFREKVPRSISTLDHLPKCLNICFCYFIFLDKIILTTEVSIEVFKHPIHLPTP